MKGDRMSESKGKFDETLETATFAGGCFWCMELPFGELDGVVSTRVGYTGGHKENPSYEEVCAGTTGHAEAVEVLYDPSGISYEKLLDVFWMNIDPTTLNKQFTDVGTQYRTAIFYHDENQRTLAEASKARLERSGRYEKPIVTEIGPATNFYVAEEYHQEYHRNNPVRYRLYRSGSGRDQYLDRVWAKDRE